MRSAALRLPGGLSAWVFAVPISLPLVFLVIATYPSIDASRLFSDTDWYSTVLPRLTSDAPLYDPAKLEPHPLQPPPFWDQAPSTALFAAVLLLPGGTMLWGGIMAASVIGGLILVWPRIGLAGTLILAPAMLLWFPMTTVLTKGNLNALVFGLLAVALRFPRAAGWAIGVAAAAKLVPILGVAWLLGRRDWRGAAIAVGIPIMATVIVLLWKGPETLIDFIVLRANQFKPDPGGRIGLVSTFGISPGIALVIGGVVALIAWWRASFTLAVIAMLASIPLMHSHYWTWILVPVLGIGLPHLLSRVREPGRSRSVDKAPS